MTAPHCVCPASALLCSALLTRPRVWCRAITSFVVGRPPYKCISQTSTDCHSACKIDPPLLPLGAGLALKARYDSVADRAQRWFGLLSSISLVVLILLTGVVNFDKVVQVFGTRGILAAILFIAVGFTIGWLTGGPGTDTKRVLALGTAQRNIAAAFVVASENFSDPRVVVMVIVVAVIGLIILVPLSRGLAQRFSGPS
jgi:BASS family bile acid:Na+ symporter